MPVWLLKSVDYYRLGASLLNHLQPVLLLVLRLHFGYQFSKGGWGKLANLQSTSEFFAGLGIPAPGINAVMAGMTELVGGACLLLGLFSRVSTIPLIGTMLVAYVTAHPDELRALFGNTNLFLKAPPFLFLLTSVLVLLFGPGCFSVDWCLARFLDRQTTIGTGMSAATPPPTMSADDMMSGASPMRPPLTADMKPGSR